MRHFISSIVFIALTSSAGCKKDRAEELRAHTDKVCAATDYASARAAWRQTLQFVDDNKADLGDTNREIAAAMVDPAYVSRSTGDITRLLTCAQKHGIIQRE